MKYFSPKKYLITAAILLFITVLISLSLQINIVVRYDRFLGEALYQFTGADYFFIFLSEIGSRNFFFPTLTLLSVIIVWKNNWAILLLLWINLLGVRFANTALKTLFERERPTLDHIVEASFYSFPSGHSMNSMAFYGMLALLSYHYMKKKSSKLLTVGCFVLLIFLIGLSRIYLGVHFPLDVFAGFGAGATWLFGLYGIYSIYVNWREKKKLMHRKNFG
ncbi:Putative undecaprenyl-diphosphatase YbjG [Bacillus sp. THAF10]|uniref:phosphatase PAP2 family protein n=1 Tax=Bacillus sp. THAF10 TaxID=2587848 RepID=UPI0012A7A51F|nr:phosphatase PAP2 family protein [Bacillus sp. THAF10]QFT89191.1 Putative undecaprenyl-diphosphatase YbjG [Bacillus sp. THAF10]